MLQPHVPQQGVVAALVEKQLALVLQAGIDFPVLVEVRGRVPAAVPVVHEQDVAFADVDEETDVAAAAATGESKVSNWRGRPGKTRDIRTRVTYFFMC